MIHENLSHKFLWSVKLGTITSVLPTTRTLLNASAFSGTDPENCA